MSTLNKTHSNRGLSIKLNTVSGKPLAWQDLAMLTTLETAFNVVLPYPFLLLSWVAVWQGWWCVALFGTFWFFSTALRQAHDCDDGNECNDCDDNSANQVFARTERNGLLNLLSANLFYHIEHHLYPDVPTHNLPKLAKRLDAIAPHWTTKRVSAIHATPPNHRQFKNRHLKTFC